MTDRRMISTNIFECSIAYRLGSEDPGLMGLAAQRVFMALILLADDFGNGRYIPANIRVRAFAATPEAMGNISEDQIDKWMKVMADEGAVEIYQVKNQRYYSLTGWEHYQRGNWRPRVSNIPKPQSQLKVSDTLQGKSEPKSPGTKRSEGKEIEQKGREEKVTKEYSTDLVEFVDEIFPVSDYQGWTDAHRLKQVDALEKLTRLDHHTQDVVFQVLRWMRADGFWSGTFQSITRLRINGQEKFLNAMGQMDKSKIKGETREVDSDPSKWDNEAQGQVEL